jgi:hypothetical protein
MKQQEVILFAKVSDFKNDEGQQFHTGKVTVLAKRLDKSSDYGRQCGHKTALLSVPYETAEALLDKVPCLANVEYSLDVNSDGAYVAVPTGVIEFVKDFKIFS